MQYYKVLSHHMLQIKAKTGHILSTQVTNLS